MSLRTASLALPFLVLCGPLAVWSIRPPRPAGAAAPRASFSAERAARHLAWIAAEPRPSFSARNALVRARLVEELAALGLEAETQVLPLEVFREAGALPELEPSAAGEAPELANVVARRRGSGAGGVLLLAAHYDSVPAGPGAADDGAAVAALLEALRALGDEPLANDLVVLLSDGEELGLLGALGFAALHPWSSEVDAVLNFEARGAGGPSILFQTGPRSAWLVERLARSAPHPFGTSLAAAVYARMPNDTDFTVFLRRDLPGLNFAFLGGGAAYHRPSDRPEVLDPGSLQQHGETLLALARDLGAADLASPPAEDELEYFPIPGGLARYPRRWTPFAALALALVVTAACARRAPLAALAGALVALAASLVAALGAFALGLGAEELVGLFSAPAALVARGANLRSGELLALGTWWSALGIGLVLAGLLERRTARVDLARGALLVWSFLALALALAVPGGGHVGLGALLGAALAHAVRARSRAPLGAALACVAWLPAALVLLPLQALFVQVGSVVFTAELGLGAAASGWTLLAALPLCAGAPARVDGPSRSRLRGALALGLGALALVASAVLRAGGS